MGIGVWQLVFILVVFILPNIPAIWVMRKAGWSGWWIIVLAIPLVGLVWTWVFAFSRWPAHDLE